MTAQKTAAKETRRDAPARDSTVITDFGKFSGFLVNHLHDLWLYLTFHVQLHVSQK